MHECNDLLLLESSDFTILDKLEGVKGPKENFTISELKYYGVRNCDVWIKGNHQASIISVENEKIFEKKIIPIFGNSSDYDTVLPLKILIGDKKGTGGKWIGEIFKNQKYEISFKNENKDEVKFFSLRSIIPEGE